jgi:hypothetical protein
MRRPATAFGKLLAFPKKRTAPCCDVELGVDVEFGLDVEPLRLVASEPLEHAADTAAKIASRTSRTTNTYCPFRSCRARPGAAQNNTPGGSRSCRVAHDMSW